MGAGRARDTDDRGRLDDPFPAPIRCTVKAKPPSKGPFSMADKEAYWSQCFDPGSECYQLWTDGLPALAILGAAVAVYAVQRQLRHSIDATRYEAVRRKRAIAKALLQEIIELTKRASSGARVAPTVHPSLAADIGRLDTDSIGAVVRFYAAYDEGTTGDQTKLISLGNAAETSLNCFLEKTEAERKRLSRVFHKRPLLARLFGWLRQG